MTIKRKLFMLSVLPIIAVLLFSLNHLLDQYKHLENQKALISSIHLLNNTNNLLHSFQIERGLSSTYLRKKTKHFKDSLKERKLNTDKNLKAFLKLLDTDTTDFLTNSNKLIIKNIKKSIKPLKTMREAVDSLSIAVDDSFKFYTTLNSQLLGLTQDLKLYSDDKLTYDEITVLKKFLQLNEFAGQERALVISFKKDNLNSKSILNFHYLLHSQNKILEDMQNLLKKSSLKDSLELTLDKYKISYLQKIRTELSLNNLEEQIIAKKWIDVSTNRINDFFNLSHSLLLDIEKNLKADADTTKASLIFQIIFTIITTALFLFGAYLVARNIKDSLQDLNDGLDNFFEFLNFRADDSKEIVVNSSDEVFEMAGKINKEIKLLKLNLGNNQDFINEVTQISMLMKDGDFSEKPYFEPSNPNLIELKIVFNELVTLISDKVKEQTKELELINSNLEDKVYQQTLKLEKQLIDVTTSRDEAINAEKSKDDFLASMSHEIRTPLNAILGFVSILKKRITEPKDVSYLNIIDTSGNSLLAIINDILDFSKIQSGRFLITPNEINPIEEFSNTTMLFASKAYEKHLIYAVYIDPNLAQVIKVDDTRVKQILSNVLSNAIKFTPRDGSIKVRILIEDDELVISVQDSGIGIAKENIGKVFSAFEQADSTTTRKYGGAGLGLSISSKLASLMNGDLSLVSTEGKGSTFTLTLPIEIIDSSSKEFFDLQKIQDYKIAILNNSHNSEVFTRLIKKYLSDLKITNIIEITEYQSDDYDILFFVPCDDYNEDIINSKKPAIAILRSNMIKLADISYITSLYAPFTPLSVVQALDDITIEDIQELSNTDKQTEILDEDEEVLFSGNVLVAEDNKTNQMLIKLILMDYEIDFEIANDGVEAVEMYKKAKYDLILMDENMPNLNGLGAMEQIKEYEKENNLEKTPIVALTANALKSDVEKFLAAGMDGFVAKPIDTTLLEAELSKYLKRV